MSTIHAPNSKSKKNNATVAYFINTTRTNQSSISKNNNTNTNTKNNNNTSNNNTSNNKTSVKNSSKNTISSLDKVLNKLENVGKQIASLPNASAKDTASLTGLAALSPSLGMAGLVLNSIGINPSKVVGGAAKAGWGATKGIARGVGNLAKGINNKIHGRKWNENNALNLFGKKGEKSKGALSKANKNNGIPQLTKTVKKGFKDVLSFLKKNKGKASKKDHSWLWMIGALLLSKIKSFFSGGRIIKSLLNLLGLGRGGGLLGRLFGGRGKGAAGLLGKVGRGAGRVALAAGAGLAVGKGTQWLAGKLGANENQAKGWGKVTGSATSGAMIGAMFGPAGALLGGALGALGGAVWHTVSEFKRVSKETKNIGDSLKNYSIEDIKAGKAVNDKNVKEVSNSAWRRGLSWVGAQFDDELAADREKAEEQRLAVNKHRAEHFKTAQYGSIDDLLKDKDIINKTLKNQGWFSKSSSEAAGNAKRAMSKAVMDYIDQQGAIGDTDIQRLGNRAKAVKYMKKQFNLSSGDIKRMYNERAVENNDFKSFDGTLGEWWIKKSSKWFTKQNDKADDKNVKATADNTDAISKLNELLTKLVDPNGMTTEGEYGNNSSPIPVAPTQSPVVVNNQQNAAPINNILAGLNN